MSDQRYDIFFAGEVLPDRDPDDVRQAVGKIFNISGEKLNRLFTGDPIRVKAGIDEETAIQYRVAFRNAGAHIQIKPAGEKPQPPEKPKAEKPTTAPEPSATFELLPPRTGDLLDSAKPEPVFQQPDLDGITLADPGAEIDDTEPAPEPAIDIHELSMSEPNTGSLENIQLKKKPQEIPDISHLKLDE